jgi:hypothetical protein
VAPRRSLDLGRGGGVFLLLKCDRQPEDAEQADQSAHYCREEVRDEVAAVFGPQSPKAAAMFQGGQNEDGEPGADHDQRAKPRGPIDTSFAAPCSFSRRYWKNL